MKLEGSTTLSRHAVIFEVKEKMMAHGAYILDHQQFSNFLLSLSFECRTERLEGLVTGIEEVGISLFQASIDQAAQLSAGRPDTTISGSLVIRFISDEPDLSIDVPAIPG